MRAWKNGLLLAGLLLTSVNAGEFLLDQKDDNRLKCTGMYSRKSWGGNVDPYILVKFMKPPAEQKAASVSLVIFEWKDEELVGRFPESAVPGTPKEYICNEKNIQNKLCDKADLNKYILAPNASESSQSELKTSAIDLKNIAATNYLIKTTGYYCVSTDAPDGIDYQAVVEFRNAYGELDGAQIAKLPFYGGLTIVYALLAVFWGFFYVQHRHDILAVQNYITAIVIFLIVEMLMTWLYYDYQNRNGSNVGSKVLMIVVAVLNAGRNSFSFFLLLIVCMGYGVVKPTLGKTMVYVRWLAFAHFVFGLIYAIASLTVTPDNAGPIVLFVILPLAGTLTAFYVWTLNSLTHTIKDLTERKQNVKAGMYRKLWICILLSIAVIFAFFFFNSITFAGVHDPDFVPGHWKTRWFILDGWLNIVYFADVAFICYMWLPTANNRRFAMSDEIAQDDEGFEIGDFGADDSGDEEEARDERGTEGPRYDAAPKSAPTKPQAPNDAPSASRHSLDGETIFAVGDDGAGWSDDEADDDNDTKKLVGKTGKDA
ncbi:hypothetical protein VE03_09318 [Pseudogymnoascus sp. 23342-1-I1]|nr:hypothetical protein VE03_09318 [Pseudogymnoascus sp. 23342-1-I1]